MQNKCGEFMDFEKAEKFISKRLNDKRLEHSKRVAKLAVFLAEKHRVSKTKAYIAGLFHDLAKNLEKERVFKILDKIGNQEKILRENYKLAHGEIAAYLLKTDFKLYDEDVLNAIRYHTYGRKNMCKLEKIIYIADATEPLHDYKNIDRIRKLSITDLDRAVYEYAVINTSSLLKKAVLIHTNAIDLINDFVFKEKNN